MLRITYNTLGIIASLFSHCETGMKNEGSGKTYSTQQVRQMGSFGTSRSGMLIPKDSNEKNFF